MWAVATCAATRNKEEALSQSERDLKEPEAKLGQRWQPRGKGGNERSRQKKV